MQAETSYPAIIGRILNNLRKDKGLKQSDITEHLNIKQSAWSFIERGQSGISMQQLYHVSKILGKEPHEILKDADVVRKNLEEDGIIVHSGVIQKPNNKMALLGLTALGLMALAILAKK